MKPTDPVALLACAIATQEGFFIKGSFPQVHNNPGDLEYEGQIGASRVVGSLLAHFESLELGVNALYRQIHAMMAQGLTLAEIISDWSTTDKAAYLKNVLAWTELPGDTPFISLLASLVPLN